MEQMNNKNLPEFLMAFQISKLIIFEVEYYTLSTNSTAHFTTSACEFIRSKRDYSCCGQAQDHLLPQGSKAREFWEKWDVKHLHDLSPEEHTELLSDIEELKKHYNYISRDLDISQRPYNPRISFYNLVELSKQTPKRYKGE